MRLHPSPGGEVYKPGPGGGGSWGVRCSLKGGHGAQGSEVVDVWVCGSSRRFRCEKLGLLPLTMEFSGLPFLSPLGHPRAGLLCSLSFLTLAVT